jgi:hypothetical protein
MGNGSREEKLKCEDDTGEIGRIENQQNSMTEYVVNPQHQSRICLAAICRFLLLSVSVLSATVTAAVGINACLGKQRA